MIKTNTGKIHQNNLSDYVFVFAHGAGADMNSDWMQSMSALLEQRGLKTTRFNFPYMKQRQIDSKRRPPDRQPKLLQAFMEELEKLPEDKKLIIGGKSMGGRMASLLVMEKAFLANPVLTSRVAGVICMGFPFHPPKKPENYRGDHLATFALPCLILQGERDTFGTKAEMVNFQFSQLVELFFLYDGDHSFKPRVKSGTNLQENLDKASQKIIRFVESL